MTVKVAINGFGRIGRLILRAIEESGRKDLQVVGINDLGDAEMNAYLLRRDSVHGTFPGRVSIEGGSLVVNGQTIRVTGQPPTATRRYSPIRSGNTPTNRRPLPLSRSPVRAHANGEP